ncbi:uncharacterized protein [Phaseolus vulgaris]|uniref:uncharacterized protein n=1 Tax=Phaseolus vulgaris TaxID=3885 RepID=UPI0035C9DF32
MEGGGQGWFQAEMSWRIGHGDRVKFWEDVCVGNTNLKSEFPRLYSLSCNQSQTVEEVGGWERDVWRWNLRWRRARFEWESVLEKDLKAYISRTIIKRQEQDIRVWGVNNKGCFSMKSAYESIRGDGTRIGVFDLLWKAKALPSVLIIAWRSILDRLPTRECLSRRGVTMESTSCVFCHSKVESSQHLFLECDVVVRVWDLCLRWIGILSVQHNALHNHFESFSLTHVSNKQEMVWKGIWASIVRSVWEHRNLVVFKQGVVDAEKMFQQAQLKSWLWMKYRVSRYNVKQVHAKAQMEWLEVLVMGVLVERPGPVLTRVLQWLGSV